MMRSLTIWLALALIGCGGPQHVATRTTTTKPTPPPPPPPEKTLELTLHVEAIVGGKRVEVASGDTLHNGDKLAIEAGVNQPAFVYVVLVSADSKPLVVFPSGSDQPINPDEGARVPANPLKMIVLDKELGEVIFAYASKQPIPSPVLTPRINADIARSVLEESAAPPSSDAIVFKRVSFVHK